MNLPEPDLTGDPSYINVDGQIIKVVMQLKYPRVVLFDNFLSYEECYELIEGAQHRIAPSTVMDNETGKPVPHPHRTNTGSYYLKGETPLVERLETRVSKLLNWPVSHGEPFQVFHYEYEQEFRPHFDYFDPSISGSKVHLEKGGQRLATFILYLCTPENGGTTIFPDANDLAIHPQAGSALFFSYDKPDKSTSTLHGGAPVLKGEKWIATKWLRESVYT